jgi:hypothetical protein
MSIAWLGATSRQPNEVTLQPASLVQPDAGTKQPLNAKVEERGKKREEKRAITMKLCVKDK